MKPTTWESHQGNRSQAFQPLVLFMPTASYTPMSFGAVVAGPLSALLPW